MENEEQQGSITINCTVLLIGVAIVMVIAVMFLFGTNNNSAAATEGGTTDVVRTTNDIQTIEITVSSGYSPRSIQAKAGIPTVIRMKSDGAYGCERAFRIPSLGISKNLPSNGNTDIEIASQKAGAILRGTCSMGMYSFVVNFN